MDGIRDCGTATHKYDGKEYKQRDIWLGPSAHMLSTWGIAFSKPPPNVALNLLNPLLPSLRKCICLL